MARTPRKTKKIETLTHGEASRKNIPTAEYQAVMEQDDRSPIRLAYQRRNRDLDPHLVWSGKDSGTAPNWRRSRSRSSSRKRSTPTRCSTIW